MLFKEIYVSIIMINLKKLVYFIMNMFFPILFIFEEITIIIFYNSCQAK